MLPEPFNERPIESKTFSGLNWHSYRLEERHAPWKVLLPSSRIAPILSVGMNGNAIASLGRTWQSVHLYDCSEGQVKWAEEQGISLRHEYKFKRIKTLDNVGQDYCAIAIGADRTNLLNLDLIHRTLKPGGAVLWVGTAGRLPSSASLNRLGFERIKRYSVFPPHSGKLLIPLDDGMLTKNALNFFKPGKWQNRIALKLVALGASAGIKYLLSAKRVVIARKPGGLQDGIYLLDWLGQNLNEPLSDITTYTGWTKLVLELYGVNGQVVGIAKMSDVDIGKHGIEKETNTLETLKATPELRDLMPRVLSRGEWGNHLVHIQTTIGSNSAHFFPGLTQAHLKFLRLLSGLDQCEMAIDEWPCWSQIWQWAHGTAFASRTDGECLREEVQQCAKNLSDKRIVFHRTHGDFSPRHVLIDPHGIKVIDWEESEVHGLPLSDLIHFIIEKTISVKRGISSIEDLLSLSLRDPPLSEVLSVSKDILPAEYESLSRLSLVHECWQRFRWSQKCIVQ